MWRAFPANELKVEAQERRTARPLEYKPKTTAQCADDFSRPASPLPPTEPLAHAAL
ncbi:Uncharacterised protein [Vibrio cholerae]|nr:Uncharacterised protein [Vibrio cholerae]